LVLMSCLHHLSYLRYLSYLHYIIYLILHRPRSPDASATPRGTELLVNLNNGQTQEG
jgi:hypothetical protein